MLQVSFIARNKCTFFCWEHTFIHPTDENLDVHKTITLNLNLREYGARTWSRFSGFKLGWKLQALVSPQAGIFNQLFN